jgi:4-amino-4-deoxy-L-arabinose transferase-like glycosyltransferase
VAALLSVALGLRLWVAAGSTRVPQADEIGYDRTGWSIATGGGYRIDKRVTYKAPGYSAFLAAVYAVAGRDYRAVRIVQAVLGASACGLVVWLGWWVAGRTEGLVAGWLAALSPPFISLTERLLSENLFIVLSLVVWLLLARVLRRSSRLLLVALGAMSGLTALTRSIGLGLVGVAALAVVFAGTPSAPRRRRLGQAAAMAAACALIILPWTLRNWRHHHAIVPIATETGLALYAGWAPPKDGKIIGFHPDDAISYQSYQMEELAADRFLMRKTLERLAADPDEIPRLLGLKFLYFWSPFDWEILGHGQGVYHGLYVLLLPFAALGLLRLRGEPRALWVLAAPIAATCAAALLFAGIPRFRLPVEPCLIVLGSAGLLAFLRQGMVLSRARLAVASGWAALNVAGIVWSAQAKLVARTILEKAGLW